MLSIGVGYGGTNMRILVCGFGSVGTVTAMCVEGLGLEVVGAKSDKR